MGRKEGRLTAEHRRRDLALLEFDGKVVPMISSDDEAHNDVQRE
jgi:hypothetical protein